MKPVVEHAPTLSGRILLSLAILGWALSLAGCQHSMAQRSSMNWTSLRVLPDADPSVSSAKPVPVDRDATYYLAREWRSDLVAPSDGLTQPRLQQIRLARGQLIGFASDENGQVVAIAGDQQELLVPTDEVHYVWYRHGADLPDSLADTAEFAGRVVITTLEVTLAATIFVGLALLDHDHHCQRCPHH